jgi:hypothetical protein
VGTESSYLDGVDDEAGEEEEKAEGEHDEHERDRHVRPLPPLVPISEEVWGVRREAAVEKLRRGAPSPARGGSVGELR